MELPVEAFELLLDDLSKTARDLASAGKDWKGKSWNGKSIPASLNTPDDPDFLLIRESHILLDACGKRHTISRSQTEPLVMLARSIWRIANPSLLPPLFQNQIKRFSRFRGELEFLSQRRVERLMRSLRKP